MKSQAKGKPKAPVSERALFARINRRLARDNEKLCRSRSTRMQRSVGEYYIVDVMRNFIAYQDVGLESLGKELGVLKPYEQLDV